MEKVYGRAKGMTEKTTGDCPGCLQGVAMQLIGKAIDDLKIQENVIGVVQVGCSTMSTRNFDFDRVALAHGQVQTGAQGINR